MSITPNKFQDCHIFSLPSQGSIYTLCRLPNSGLMNQVSSRCRLLVASLRRPVFLLEFSHGYKQSLVPYSRELGFTYLPGHAEIVSITSFSKPGSTATIIGVAYIKVGENGQCLNIYTVKENGSDLNGDGLAFSCSVEIDFIPYHLTHCPTSNDVIVILSGSDYKVHLFCEDSITHIAQEKKNCEEFPEFLNEFPSVVLWIKFHLIDPSHRLTAVGCECGTFFLYEIKSNTIVSVSKTNHGTSITSSTFFSSDLHTINLLVTSALLPATLYWNVVENKLKESCVLIGSEKHDVVTCSLVCDIQMDQQPTILIGTYGQELLAYRTECEGKNWVLAWTRSFSHPILALDYCDVTGDGVRELIALTTRGVQVLQHDLEEVSALFIQRFSIERERYRECDSKYID